MIDTFVFGNVIDIRIISVEDLILTCNVLSSTCRSRSGFCDGCLGLCCSTVVDFSLFTAICKDDIVDSVVFRVRGCCP